MKKTSCKPPALSLAPSVITIGAMGPERNVAAVRDYSCRIPRNDLARAPIDPLLTGPSKGYLALKAMTRRRPVGDTK